MKELITRIMSCVLVVMIMSHDVDYCAWANEMSTEEIIEVGEVEFVKANYTQKERDDIMKTAMSKLDEGEEITEEESAVIDWAYQELKLTLPEEELVWDTDHENGVGVAASTMSTRAAVSTALIRGAETTVIKRGVVPYKTYSDGEGGTYNIKTAIGSYYFIMPGIEQTTVGQSVCNRMIPQGSCYYDGYIFLTAYCQEENGTGSNLTWSSVHQSVIYVLDASTKDYITTMVMPNKSHAGGITYADGYLWVSHTGSGDTGYVYYYSYSEIKSTLEYVVNDSSVTAIDLSKITRGSASLGAGNKASFLTTYKGYLCVGEYYKDKNDTAKVYLYTPDVLRSGGEPEISVGTIPGNANGMVFYTIANKTYLLINANEGYLVPSFSYIYEINSVTNKITSSYKKRMELPCMVEEAFIYGGRVYFVFESGAYKYREIEHQRMIAEGEGGLESVIGEVCSLTTTFVFK